MWATIKKLGLFCLIITMLFGCNKEKSVETSIKVGTIAGPETEMMRMAKAYAQEKYKLNIDIVEFHDYATTNVVVADKSIDANASQTIQFFEQWKKNTHNDTLVTVANTFIYPMGLYSQKIKNVSELPAGARVAIPNDPSNEERALLLLEKAGLITLKKNSTGSLRTAAIEANPLKLEILTLAPAQLPRTLSEVSLAVINTNYALPAGLSPTKDAIFVEGKDSPYANIIITRKELENDQRIAQLIEAYHSAAVVDKAKVLFKDQVIPAWGK